MSGNGKIMCNHGVNLFKCQTCIDALVAEQIEKQEQRITELEQQLKTAKADGVREFASKYCGDRKRDEQIWLSTAALLYCEEYDNNLEGK